MAAMIVLTHMAKHLPRLILLRFSFNKTDKFAINLRAAGVLDLPKSGSFAGSLSCGLEPAALLTIANN